MYRSLHGKPRAEHDEHSELMISIVRIPGDFKTSVKGWNRSKQLYWTKDQATVFEQLHPGTTIIPERRMFEQATMNSPKDAIFVRNDGKSFPLKLSRFELNDSMMDEGETYFSLTSDNASAIPDLKKDEKGVLQFTNDDEEDGSLIHTACGASVWLCEPTNGRLVFVAESGDGVTAPHSIAAL